MPFVLPLAAASAALVWAIWAGFGGAVTGQLATFEPLRTPKVASAPTFAAFLGGFGLSGALVHELGHVSPLAEVGLAVVTGCLLAGLVRAIVALAAGAEAG